MTHLKMLTPCLGDTLAVSPLWSLYQRQFNEEVVVTTKHKELFIPVYPNISFRDYLSELDGWDKIICLDSVQHFNKPLQQGFWEDLFSPIPYREVRPTLKTPGIPRAIRDKYVCIATQSTIQGKYWNFPDAWNILIRNLKNMGFRVICIDQYKNFGIEGHFNKMPSEAEDFTGKPLIEVINLLEHCEFFIGLTSGLSWLAHSLNKHVVMISGITHKWCEFTIDITRIINEKVCHGCFSEPETTLFDSNNWMWCPKKSGTIEEFICTKSIDPYIVLQHIIDAGILNENRSIDRGTTGQVFNFAHKSRKN